MAVTLERGTSFGYDFTQDATISTQVDAANDVVVALFGYRANDSADVTAVARNSQVFTQVASQPLDTTDTNPLHRLEAFARLNASTGTSNTVGTNAVFKPFSVGSLVFAGADTTTPIPAGDVTTGVSVAVGGTTVTATVPNMTSNDLAVLVMLWGNYDNFSNFSDRSGATITDGSSQTRVFERWSSGTNAAAAGSINRMVVTTKTGTGSLSISQTSSFDQVYCYIAFRVAAAAGGGGGSAAALLVGRPRTRYGY